MLRRRRRRGTSASAYECWEECLRFEALPLALRWSLGWPRLGIFTDSKKDPKDEERGVPVRRLVPGEGAEEAGLRPGDLITAVNGFRLTDPLKDAEEEEEFDDDLSLPFQRLRKILKGLEPGDTVSVQFLRDGKARSAHVVLSGMEGSRVPWGVYIDGYGSTIRAYPYLRDLEWMHDPGAESKRLPLRLFHWDEEGAGKLRKRLEEALAELETELETERGKEAAELKERLREAVTAADSIVREFSKRRRDRLEVVRPEIRLQLLDSALALRPRVSVPLLEAPGLAPSHSRISDLFSSCPTKGKDGTVISLRGDCVAGLRLEELNPELGEYFGAKEGVLIMEVSEASKLGLRPGDVIISVDGREIDGISQLRRILRSYEAGEEVEFKIVRKERERTIKGHL